MAWGFFGNSAGRKSEKKRRKNLEREKIALYLHSQLGSIRRLPQVDKCFPIAPRGSIAQLVQSICLTSRGSGVRIPVLPQEKTNPKPPCKGGFFFLSPGKTSLRCTPEGSARERVRFATDGVLREWTAGAWRGAESGQRRECAQGGYSQEWLFDRALFLLEDNPQSFP